jgi:multidrug transporter EmrE-like cation transporter
MYFKESISFVKFFSILLIVAGVIGLHLSANDL